MEPPSYEEARLHPPAVVSGGFTTHPPPPSYNASYLRPPTPPPTYGEAVTAQSDPFPVLTPPRVPPVGSLPSQNTGVIIHPTTQIGVSTSVSSRQAEPVVTQPQPVPVLVTHLRGAPAVIQCPHCHQVDATKVKHQPGKAAWYTCLLLCLMGVICGCCLIPFMVPSLQDVHHSCSHCGKHLHTHTR